MICRNCGGKLEKVVADLPFKVNEQTIVIIKQLPVLQYTTTLKCLISLI